MAQQELARGAARRLAVIRHAQEVTGNVGGTCRYYGVSRQSFYKWLRRYEELGIDGLRDRSRRPHVSPNATSTEVVGKIVYLRRSYHFGPHKIAMYLGRYHDVVISPSGVWRILRRLQMNRLPRLPALPAPHRPVEALREAPARTPGPGRRQVHRSFGRLTEEALPVHRDR